MKNINYYLFLFIYILYIFKVNSECPLDPNWRLLPASSAPTQTSPPISTIHPASDIVYGANDLFYMAKWGYSDNSITDVANSDNDSEFSVNFDPWAPDYFMILSVQSPPALKANVNYQFSFDFKLGQPLGEVNNYDNMTLSFYQPDDHHYFFWSYRAPTWALTFTGDFSSHTEFKTTSVTFSLPFELGLSQLVLQVNRTTPTAYDPTNFFIRNMKVTVLPRAVSTPSDILTSDSELINIPKAPTALDEQDLSTCPYFANDLVHWHNPSTWDNNVVPSPDSVITLPANKKVLISPCSISQTEIYKKIIIPASSELIFADSDITMNVQDIYVQGKFIMGTTMCRYNAFINIIFHGSKTFDDTISQYYGSKGIAVSSTGFISIQGKQYHSSWTKLSSTAWSGDRIIYIQDSVNWEVGQKVLITTSIYKDEVDNQNEVMTIKAISTDGKIIEFTTPLKFYHYGGKEYQAEVALLTRRIVFQGNTASEAELFGGHILVNGEGQFSGIQLLRMGQQNIKARYPIHYHLAGDVQNSYVKDCVVTNSYYRCYTIHGTNNVTLTRNVAFDAYGHCYYLEDGVEMDNTLSFNLAAFVHTIGTPAAGPAQIGETFVESANLRQPADSAAGGFYITNAWNSIIGNSASGGWAGYSFPGLPAPIGNHQNVVMEPRAFTTKVFEGNTAHSSGYYFISGASIYVGGLLQVDPTTGLLVYNTGRHDRKTCVDGIASYDPSTFLWMRFNNTKVYLSNHGIAHWGQRVEVVNLEAYDSNRPGTLFGTTLLSKAIVDGQSGNVVSRYSETRRQGFQFYDTYVQTILSHITFRNYIHSPASVYEDDDNVAIIALTFSDVYKPQYISATVNISFVNVPLSQRIGHRNEEYSGSSRFQNFIDWDGSMVGRNNPSIVGAHESWWNFDSTCQFKSDWNVWVCDKGDRTVANLEFWIPGLIEPGVIQNGDSFVGSVSLFGNGITDIRKTNITRNAGITGVSNNGWMLYLNDGTPTYLDVWVSQVAYSQWILLAIPYPAGTTFNIYTQNKWAWNNYRGYNCTSATTLEEVKLGDGSKYYFDNNHLFIKILNNALDGLESEYFVREGVKIEYVYWEYHYHIYASNLNVQPVNGYYKDLQYSLPSPSSL